MPITFQVYHAYNKVFFLNLNKSAFYPPIFLVTYGASDFHQVLGGCKIERL